jgi:hypothetical protein
MEQDFTELNYSAHFEKRTRIEGTPSSSTSVVQTGLITKCTKVLFTSSTDRIKKLQNLKDLKRNIEFSFL